MYKDTRRGDSMDLSKKEVFAFVLHETRMRIGCSESYRRAVKAWWFEG